MTNRRKNIGNFRSLLKLHLQHQAGRIIEPNLHKKARGRYTLLKTLPKNSTGAEIGVWKGEFSSLIAEIVQPNTLYLIDPWLMPSGQREVLQRDKVGVSLNIAGAPVSEQRDLDDICEHVKSMFQHTPGVKVIRSTSENASKEFENTHLDWVYIDGSHYYEDVKSDLALWTPKLRPGGLLCGDDYYWRDPSGEYSVKRAVSEYVKEHSVSMWRVYRSQYVIYT
jgi:Methyltransferase domain